MRGSVSRSVRASCAGSLVLFLSACGFDSQEDRGAQDVGVVIPVDSDQAAARRDTSGDRDGAGPTIDLRA